MVDAERAVVSPFPAGPAGPAGWRVAGWLPLVALLAANAVSLVGNALTAVALPWFVLATTGSPARAGLVAAAGMLPAAAAGIFGGAVIDRLGFKRTSVAADLISGLGVAAIPLLLATVGLPFWLLLGLVAVGALLDIPGLTARRSLLPELAVGAGWRLERANAALEANNQLAMLLGPPLAGLLIVWLGPSNVLWLDAASFALSAGLVAVLVPAAKLSSAAAAVRRGYRHELAAGLRFLRDDRLLLTLAVLLMAGNAIGGPLFAVFLPVYAAESSGRATAVGLAIAAVGVGGVVGALGYGAIGHRLSRRRVWLAGYLVGPLSLWALGFSAPLPWLLAVLVVGGLAMGPINPLLVTIRHERIPPELRGRVFAAFSATAMVAQPIGLPLGGLLVERAGLGTAVLVTAAAGQLLGLVAFLLPRLREMDRPWPAPAPEATDGERAWTRR